MTSDHDRDALASELHDLAGAIEPDPPAKCAAPQRHRPPPTRHRRASMSGAALVAIAAITFVAVARSTDDESAGPVGTTSQPSVTSSSSTSTSTTPSVTTAPGSPILTTIPPLSELPAAHASYSQAFAWGTGDDQVAFHTPHGEGASGGPVAFSADAAGNIAMLDHSNARIVHFEQHAYPPTNIALASPAVTAAVFDRTGRVFVATVHDVAVFGPQGESEGSWNGISNDMISGLEVVDNHLYATNGNTRTLLLRPSGLGYAPVANATPERAPIQVSGANDTQAHLLTVSAAGTEYRISTGLTDLLTVKLLPDGSLVFVVGPVQSDSGHQDEGNWPNVLSRIGRCRTRKCDCRGAASAALITVRNNRLARRRPRDRWAQHHHLGGHQMYCLRLKPVREGARYRRSPAPSCARAAAGATATARLTATAAMRRGAGTPRDGSVAPRVSVPRHILVLTDRDWTHPEAGGTGTVLYGQVSRWVAWGHRVTVIAGDYPGAERVSHLDERLTVHRMGTRLTVFPRAAWATFRGLGRDADVVLEVCNGIAFFTSVWRWMRKPRVLLVFHVHQEHYVTELGLRGRVAAFLLEHVPLRVLYPGVPVITISQSSREDLVALGVDRQRMHVVYCGLDSGSLAPGPKAPEPTLIYLGRLKQYKRIELLLDVLDAIPEAHLDLAGDGDHRAALEAEVERRALGARVTFHGHVDEEEKARLLARAWVALTASSAEGWCLTVFEAAACGTPTAAMRVGGLGEAIVDGQTGLLADDPAELVAAVRDLVERPEQRAALGQAALERARGYTWDSTAQGTLTVMDGAMAAERSGLRAALARSDSGKAAGLAAATLGNNAIQLVFTVVFTRLLGQTDYGTLAALISAFLILLVAGQSVQLAAAREAALDRLGHPEVLRATLRAWTRQLLVALVAVTAASVLLREPLAALIGVQDVPWAAAAIPPTGVLWMLLSLQRGALQGCAPTAPSASRSWRRRRAGSCAASSSWASAWA